MRGSRRAESEGGGTLRANGRYDYARGQPQWGGAASMAQRDVTHAFARAPARGFSGGLEQRKIVLTWRHVKDVKDVRGSESNCEQDSRKM